MCPGLPDISGWRVRDIAHGRERSGRSRTPFDHLQNETQIASSGRQPIAARRRMASQSSGMRWARPYWMMASYCSLSEVA